MNLKIVSNEELISRAETEVRLERESTLKIIKLFQEIYDRKLYLDRGFPNFYEMVTKHFGYCASSAMRRINAMKLIREIPQVESKLESGELSLSVASDVQSFLYQEAKEDRGYSKHAKIELVESCLGKTRKEAEEEFARRNPERERKESLHVISHDRLRISFSISKDLNDKLNHLKDLLSHVDPCMTTEVLIDRLAELGLDKYDPERKAARARAREEKRRKECQATGNTQTGVELEAEAGSFGTGTGTGIETEADTETETNSTSAAEVNVANALQLEETRTTKRSRYIPAQERHAMKTTACSYVDPTTGRRCGTTRFLQRDHIQPFSHGGANTTENLRWMCGAHNRWRAQDRFKVAE